jgi:hypothetical protein
LQFSVNEDRTGYNVRLSSQRDGKLTAVSHSITLAEGEILRILLENAVLQMVS